MLKCLAIGLILAVLYTVYIEMSERKKQKVDTSEVVTEDAE